MRQEKIVTFKLFENRIVVELKPIMRLAAIAAISEIVLAAILFAAARPSNTQSSNKYFSFILLALISYAVFGRMFKKELHTLFEQRIADMRRKVMDLVRRADLRSFEQIGAEYLYTALTFDVKAVSELSHTIAATTYAAFLMIGILLYLAILSEYAFFLTLTVGGIVGFFYSRNQTSLRQVIAQVREGETRLFEAVKDLLEGFKALRLNNKKNDDFFQRSLQHHIAHLQQVKLQTARHFVYNYVVTYGLWIALILAPIVCLPLVGILSRNALITFLGLILFIPTNYLVEEIPRIILAGISIQRLVQLEQTVATLEPEPGPFLTPTAPIVFTELLYQDITFHYEEPGGYAFTLGPLTMSLRSGEVVFITGGNGSGKTTLLKLMIGLYQVDAGQGYLNGQEIPIQQYRSLFAPVFSDFHLFDRLYGLPEVEPTKVNELLALMQLEEKVQFVDQRFSTLDLSTGQKKRLALLAAMMEDKPIYVFDEWAADQDAYFREYFYHTLLSTFKAQGKTVIAVTHDDRYFYVADRILKMEYGKLI
jgi:putative ATP-binding cassette transporter